MDWWTELLDTEEDWEHIERPPSQMPPIRTPAYHAARQRRIQRLRQEIDAGTYHKPAELIAEAILMGRTRWGERLIDAKGRRRDEHPDG